MFDPFFAWLRRRACESMADGMTEGMAEFVRRATGDEITLLAREPEKPALEAEPEKPKRTKKK